MVDKAGESLECGPIVQQKAGETLNTGNSALQSALTKKVSK
jgi:hypothetical protein